MNNSCRRFVRHSLLLVAMALSSSCFAELSNPATSPVAGPRWACWYESSNLTLRCLLSRAPSNGVEARAAAVSRTIDQRLPGLVRTIWGSPEKLAGNRISIPLWAVPEEMDFARELAEAVMCGARQDCSVHFDANPDGRAPVRAAALEAGASEAAVMAELLSQGIQLAAVETTVTVEPERRASRRRRAAMNG